MKEEQLYGFYTGLKLLNSLRLTTQVPNTPEIVTNKVKSKEVNLLQGENKASLRVKSLPAGIYFLQLESKEGVQYSLGKFIRG